jgi:hypothetical protein
VRFCAMLLPLMLAASIARAIEKIELTCVDEHATGYGTFQSHNQKVLSNAAGIFMTHIRSRNEAYTAQQWRLSHSTDGGKTFATIFEALNATNPGVIETDESANLYLIRPDFLDNNSYLYCFAAADKYKNPRITPIPGSAAGKFAMWLDQKRGQIYYLAQNHTFHIVALDGTVRSSSALLKAGPHAVMQYPSLCMERDVLHVAWTTSLPAKYLYWDIHAMQSPDGAKSWRKMDGSPLAPPIVADDTGSADRISLDDDFEIHCWLSNFLIRDGKGHFLYLAQQRPWRQHYVRYELASAKREIDVQPTFKGEQIELAGLDGFFAAGADTLYCVGHTPDGRIGCLASDDNGTTWHDHAQSEPLAGLYAVGGARDVTSDGSVTGSCTAGAPGTEAVGVAKVHFFKIPPRAKAR